MVLYETKLKSMREEKFSRFIRIRSKVTERMHVRENVVIVLKDEPMGRSERNKRGKFNTNVDENRSR